MKENLIKLENWYEPLKDYKHLTLEKAKEITIKMQETTNELEKKKIADELILGTMHVLYKQLKNSYFLYLPSKEMDIKDVINTASEVWIKYILEGNLQNIAFYSDFFRHTFYEKIFAILGSSTFSYLNYFNCSKEKIIEIALKYIEICQQKDTFSYEELESIFKEIPNWTLHYPLFEEVKKLLTKMHFFSKENFSKRKLVFLLFYLIEQVVLPIYNPKNSSEEALKIEQTMEEVEKNILRQRACQLYKQIELPSLRNKQIFSDISRLYDYPKKAEYIANLYGISKEKVEWIQKDIYKKIRRKEDSSVYELQSIYEELVR